MTKEDEIIKLLEEIVKQIKKQTEELTNIKNLFLKYDMEEFMNDENIRNG